MNKLNKVFKTVGVFLLFLFFSSLFFVALNIDTKNISDMKYIIYLSISNLILLGIYIYIYHKDLSKDFKDYFEDFNHNFDTSLKYWLTGFGIMAISNIIISYILNMTIAGNEENVRNFIDVSPLLMLFNASIYAPIVEELTFRKSIRDVISNKWFYALVSGLLFAFMHIMGYITNPIDTIYLIPYGALGISFALLYYKTNNIFSTITMHAMHNTIAILFYLLVGGLLWRSLLDFYSLFYYSFFFY